MPLTVALNTWHSCDCVAVVVVAAVAAVAAVAVAWPGALKSACVAVYFKRSRCSRAERTADTLGGGVRPHPRPIRHRSEVRVLAYRSGA